MHSLTVYDVRSDVSSQTHSRTGYRGLLSIISCCAFCVSQSLVRNALNDIAKIGVDESH